MAAGADDASACVALGLACRTLGDLDSALVAVDRALGHEPRNLRALILKGDLLAGLGDARAASSFYLAVANHARAMGEVPADLRPEVDRARALCERFAGQLEEGVRARLRGRGLLEEKASGRFLQSLDILFGHRQPYFQQPRYYFFPGLPQIQFFDRALFPWMDGLESATAEIRAELAGAMGEEDSAFTPYVQSDPRRPRKDQDGLLDNPDWSALYLWKNGEVVPENAARCPRTLEALAGVPLPRIPNRSPSILFSQLQGRGAHSAALRPREHPPHRATCRWSCRDSAASASATRPASGRRAGRGPSTTPSSTRPGTPATAPG